MKINIQPSYGVYKNRAQESGGMSGVHGVISASRHTDRNSITRGTTTVSDRQLLLMKSSVQDYISAPADRSRLDGIRDSIHNGTYHIPTGELVDAILADE